MFKKVLFRRNYKNCILNKNYALVINTCNVNTCNTKVYKTCVSDKTTILVKQFERNVHVSNVFNAKQFGEIENKYVFDIVKKIQISNVNNDLVKVTKNINNAKDFTYTLNQNWRQSNATEIVNAFKSLKDYCINNNIPVSDSHFDKLVDGLMDNCENLTDIELYDLLSCLSEYPPCESFTSHNFHDIWSCLDDICCWKMSEWDYDKMFEFANLWYKLNLGRLCDFVFELLGRLVKRADHLTKDQLVNIFFLFNVVRKRPVDFEYEYALQNCISQMNIDEMAVVTLGYFKTQSKIKLDSILKPMIHAVAFNSKTIHEISLTAILKAVRFSKPLKLVDDIKLMLDKLVPETNRLSDLCCLHISLMGTGLLFLHQKSVQTASEKIAKNMRVVRLKDVERILNVLSMFNYDPQTEPEIFKAAFEELHKPERMEELIKYPRCLNCALNYLSLRNIYSYELMDRVLDVEHIKTNYGTGSKVVPPELVSLNASIDVECPGYTGNRLPPLLKYRSPKWRLEWLPNPDRNKKFTATEQLVFDAINVVKKIVKNDELMHIEHVLPHFSRADIILCKEKSTGKFRKPIGFENYTLGDVMFPFNDGTLEWYAVMMLGWNNTIRDTSLPLGNMIMKERQLKKIGYKPVKIIWNEFYKLSDYEKIKYVTQKLV